MSSSSVKETNFAVKGLRLKARNGQEVDLDSYFLAISIQEDIWGNAVHGTLIITDNYNLTRDMPLEGTESLYINIISNKYPDDPLFQIKKDFRVYNVSDKVVDAEKGTQQYNLHFVSWEAFRSVIEPVFAPFEGVISDVAQMVFDEHIAEPRWAGGPHRHRNWSG